MDERVMADVLRRLARLERESVRLRMGEVSDRGPLDVTLGGSSVAYEDVQAIGEMDAGEKVAVLLAGNDLLVLGAMGLGWRWGVGSVTGAGTSQQTDTVTHDLGVTPEGSIAVIGGGANAGLNVGVDSMSSTLITFRFRHVDAANWSSTNDYYWLAWT